MAISSRMNTSSSRGSSMQAAGARTSTMSFLHRVFGLTAECSIIAFAGILGAGLATTQRVGIPTISRMINDNLALDACLMASLFVYFQAIFLLTYLHFVDTWNGMCLEARWLSVAAAVFTLLEGGAMLEVTVVSIDENQTGHYVVAGMSVGFAWCREILLAGRRRLMYCSLRSGTRLAFYVCNWLIIALLTACTIAYVILSANDVHDFVSVTKSLLEYQIFYCVVALPIFQLMDIGEAEHVHRAACLHDDDIGSVSTRSY